MTLGSINRNAIRETRKVFVSDPSIETIIEYCPICRKQGQEQHLRFFHINMSEAVYKCNSSRCLYPFQNFLYKNVTDNTIYRYERIRMPLPSTTSLKSIRKKKHQLKSNESQIVPHTPIPNEEPFTFDDSTMHDSIFGTPNNSNFDEDTITSCSNSNDSCANENYSLEMFSLENLLSSSTSATCGDKESTSISLNDEDDGSMDCINEIIDDICNTTDFTNLDYTENDFDCTISDLAKYIDGGSPKKAENSIENISSINASFNKKNQISYEKQIDTSIPIQVLKPTVDRIDLNSTKSLSSSTITKTALNRSQIEKKPRKPRAKKDNTISSAPKINLPQLLRQNCDVTDKYKTLVDNKDNFKPLDLLHSVFSLKLDHKPTESSIKNDRLLFGLDNQHLTKSFFYQREKKKIEEKPKFQPVKSEPMEEFNEGDIKQNIIRISPFSDYAGEKISHLNQIIDVKPKMENVTADIVANQLDSKQRKRKTKCKDIIVTRIINLPNSFKVKQ